MSTNTFQNQSVRYETVRLTLEVQLKHDPEYGEQAWAVYWEDGATLLGHVFPDLDPEEWTWYYASPSFPRRWAGGYEDAIQALVESGMELR